MVKFPALAEEQDVLGRQPGEALWPEMYSRERLEQVRTARTPYYWQAMYQQNPQAEGSAEWPAEFFGPEIWFEEWPREWRCKAVALDPSKGTDAKHGDYSAFAAIMLGLDGKLYVDADLALRNCTIIAETALEIQRWFQPDWFAVEVNQFQQLLADEMWRLGQERNVLIPLWTYENRVNKRVRIRRLTPWLSRRDLRFKANSPGARLLVEQLRDFPHADHDDGPDALEMALRVLCEQLAMAEQDQGPTRVYA